MRVGDDWTACVYPTVSLDIIRSRCIEILFGVYVNYRTTVEVDGEEGSGKRKAAGTAIFFKSSCRDVSKNKLNVCGILRKRPHFEKWLKVENRSC